MRKMPGLGVATMKKGCQAPCLSGGHAVYRGMSVPLAVADLLELQYRQAFDRHWDDVFRFLLAWTNDWSAAEDLAQETYLQLWRHRSRLDWDMPMLPWLLVAARRLATNRFHALRRRVLFRTADAIADGAATDEAARIRWLDVSASLSRLSALERTALLMTVVEGWSYGELARATGSSEGALRAAVSRARHKLEVA